MILSDYCTWKGFHGFQKLLHWDCDGSRPLFDWEQLDTCVSWLGSKLQHLFRHRPARHATVWGSNEQKKFSWGTDTVGHKHFYTSTPPSIFILSLHKKEELNKRQWDVLWLWDKGNLLFCPRLLSGTLGRDGSHAAMWVTHRDCLPCGLTELEWQEH